ncbi:MAG: hypothetical protein O7G13_06185, partial [Alphaproteobacteria bacterium]|nr:hypothetical protein [Alphaproteobacteria bacterium]
MATQPMSPQGEVRQGPRPLPLHLTTALNSWLSSQAALPLLKNGSIDWRPEVAARAAALNRQLANAVAQQQKAAPGENEKSQKRSSLGPQAGPFDLAVTQEIFHRLHGLAAGIKAYRRHPYQRKLPTPPVLWRDGTTRLLDFRPDGGQPVLFVPSLVNRAYILDLSAEHSLLRWL